MSPIKKWVLARVRMMGGGAPPCNGKADAGAGLMDREKPKKHVLEGRRKG